MKDMVKTGVAGLDKLLGGGLSKGSISTLSGTTGSGRSTLALQFLVNGAKMYNEPGLYVVIEETRDSMLKHMNYRGWDLEELEGTKQLTFLDYPAYEVDQFMSQNSAIGELIDTMGIERLVIDSIMPVALLFATADQRKKGFLEFVHNIRKWKTTTLIVTEAHSQEGTKLPQTAYGLESLTDGWVHMDYSYSKGKRQRGVEVLKMKGRRHLMKRVPFDIGEKGVEMKV